MSLRGSFLFRPPQLASGFYMYVHAHACALAYTYIHMHVNMYLCTAHTRKVRCTEETEAAADCQKFLIKRDWTSSGAGFSQPEFLERSLKLERGMKSERWGRKWCTEPVMLEKCWGLLGAPDEITSHSGAQHSRMWARCVLWSRLSQPIAKQTLAKPY